jgi:hypothetical protein
MSDPKHITILRRKAYTHDIVLPYLYTPGAGPEDKVVIDGMEYYATSIIDEIVVDEIIRTIYLEY